MGQKVISLAEQSKILNEYTSLNDDFKIRLKDENRLTDEREIGEKHPILESPPPQSSKKNEREEEEEKARIGRGMEGI